VAVDSDGLSQKVPELTALGEMGIDAGHHRVQQDVLTRIQGHVSRAWT
jgi:hypothetical protein